MFEAKNSWLPHILKRVDARYDWLPSPKSTFSNSTLPAKIVAAADGCRPRPHLEGFVAVLLRGGGCDFSRKVAAMNESGAAGVIFVAAEGDPLREIICLDDEECDGADDYAIPASVVPFSHFFVAAGANLTVRFQTTPSPNLCFTVDRRGKLGECGWLLYPSLRFYAWQAQWLSYEQTLRRELDEVERRSVSHRRRPPSTLFSSSSSSSFSSLPFPFSIPSSATPSSLIIDAFDFTTMQGRDGVVASVKLPPAHVMLRNVTRVRLDASLSCPGVRDEDCPPWDHTVQLFVCCDVHSELCGAELGRWITPFRRRVGRWLTDVTPLLPLLLSTSSNVCKVTMKTVPWAKPWKPALRFLLDVEETIEDERMRTKKKLTPVKTFPLFRGGTFDADYNAKYEPMFFMIPSSVVKVVVVAVITGHGSDDNQCGEFCPTSHVFLVNGKVYNRTFEDAGTPLGCAETVPGGSIPNEHGTWLYGRGGWCDGRQVDPWVVDVSGDVRHGENGSENDSDDDTVQEDGNGVGGNEILPDWRQRGRRRKSDGTLIIDYKGYFRGKDPDPKEDPGNIIMYSYLTLYELT